MARRSRSLSELPGHLRVPILKRKDTERTQARLQAGLAGMEELRVLREHQQQLVGDTMARVETRQQRRHSTPHRQGDDGVMTPVQTKSRSIGQKGPGHPDAIPSWLSTSSLASISEEGDSSTSREADRTENRVNCSYNNTKPRDNQNVVDCSFAVRGHHQDSEWCSQKRHLRRSQSDLEERTRSWRSQEHVCQMSRPDDKLHAPAELQSSKEVGNRGDRSMRRSMSFSLSSGNPGQHNLSYGNAFSSHRRNSTSMINDLQSGRSSRSSLSHVVHIKGKGHAENQRRHPLSSLSNIHIPTDAAASANRCSHSYAAKVISCPDKNCSQISWDNLLKTIGLSTSASSLPSLVEDENVDKNDDVFDPVESQDETNDNTDSETQQPLRSDKSPRQRMGRSFSFCHGSMAQNSRNFSHLLFQERTENTFEEEDDAASCELDANPRQSFHPIMRRASMQCEAVLTKSSMAKRRVNPIQDVDINTLSNPGPVHAVMLQYTSQTASVLSSSPNNSKLISSEHTLRNSRESNPSESEHKYLKIACRESGSGCQLVKTNIGFQILPSRAHEYKNPIRNVNKNDNHIINNAKVGECGMSGAQYAECHSLEINSNKDKHNSKAKTEFSPSVIGKERKARYGREDCSIATVVIPEDTRSKAISNPIDTASTTVHADGDIAQIREQSPGSVKVEEQSKMGDNLEESLETFDTCSKESPSFEDRVKSNNEQEMEGHVNDNYASFNQVLYDPGASKLLHLEGKERCPDKIRIRRDASVAMALTSTQADMEINDSPDGHVIKYCRDDVSKASSDMSIVSDEGYYTCESLVSTIKTCSQSRKNEVNLLHSSPASESISSAFGDTIGQIPNRGQESMTERRFDRMNFQEQATPLRQSNVQALSGPKESQHDGLAVSEPSAAFVFNPELCKQVTKSLHNRVFVCKSLKQTAV